MVKVDFRVIAATNRDLLFDTRDGIFREDHFHRIAVAVIKLPSLRDRPDDIGLLSDYYLEEINKDFRNQKGWTPKTISKEGLRSLKSYPWPGNVRELVNTIMRIAIWSIESSISSEDVEAALL